MSELIAKIDIAIQGSHKKMAEAKISPIHATYISDRECDSLIAILTEARIELARPPSDAWVPVSERLPEKDGEYPISDIDADGNPRVRCEWFINGTFPIYNTIKAWMELPTSYIPAENAERENEAI